MKMKLAFSLALSLILLISVPSTILLIDTPSPVLAENGDGGGHPPPPGGDDGGNDLEYYEERELVEAARDLWQMEPPEEGQKLGEVQNMRDPNGDIIVTADGVPVLGRLLFDESTGEPIYNYDVKWEGEKIYITNIGRMSVPVEWYYDLAPGLRSGPRYERFAYTPPPGFGDPIADDQTQDSPPPVPTPEPENQGDQTQGPPPLGGQTQGPPPPGGQTQGPPPPGGQTQDPPPPGGIPPSETPDGELPPSKAFRDNTQFGKPQPVMGPTNNPLVDEDGAPVLGRVVLDEEGKTVIGPNGEPIIVIPD